MRSEPPGSGNQIQEACSRLSSGILISSCSSWRFLSQKTCKQVQAKFGLQEKNPAHQVWPIGINSVEQTVRTVNVVEKSPANAGDVGDAGSIPEWGRSPGEGNGSPLQYSCLENSEDRGAWWATVHKVAKSQT